MTQTEDNWNSMSDYQKTAIILIYLIGIDLLVYGLWVRFMTDTKIEKWKLCWIIIEGLLLIILNTSWLVDKIY